MASSVYWSLVAIRVVAKDVLEASPVGDLILSEGHRVTLKYSLQQPLASLLNRKHTGLGGPGS